MSNRTLRLYKQLLREGSKFADYNFREYTLRKIKDTFRQNMNETDACKIKDLNKSAEENLEVIKRQVAIGNMYSHNKIVVEGKTVKWRCTMEVEER